MKPIFRCFLILLLCGALLLPAQAVPSDLTLSDGQAAAGEVVYLTLTLNKATRGDTMGAEYSYDSSHLEPVPELCSWSKGGSIKDFGLKGRGVWATAIETTLEGNICVLAFRIKKGAEFDQTTVSCTLIVKSGADQTGKFTADAKVRIACTHSFTNWAEDGAAFHSRSCENCGISQTEIHQWDTGVVQTDPQNSTGKIRLFTCTVCGATKQEKIDDATPETTNPTNPTQPTEPSRPQPTEPSRPQPTEPSRPQPTEPSRPQATEPTVPQATQPQNTGYPQNVTQPTVPPGENPEEHDHVHPTVPTQPVVHGPDDGDDHSGVIYDSNGNILAIPIQNPQETTDEIHSPDDGHDHSDEQILITQTQPKGDTALILVAVAVVGITAAVFFVKKKKR